jgi:hypothetical protein
LDEVQSATGFELDCSARPSLTPEPTAAELRALREIDSAGLLRFARSQRRNQ